MDMEMQRRPAIFGLSGQYVLPRQSDHRFAKALDSGRQKAGSKTVGGVQVTTDNENKLIRKDGKPDDIIG
ncbi:MAG TPA: hypothetical protein ENI69_07235 [Rhodospirillales bacterium]|nr:hypothetical protein [Rhodospirillales bacterium]